MLQGLQGKRQAQFGDVIRTTGFGGALNEPLSATTGFFSQMGMINLATKGKLIEATKKAQEIARENNQVIFSRLPKRMNDSWLRNQATKTYQVADDTVKSIQSEYDDLFNAKNVHGVSVGDSPVDMDMVQRVADSLADTDKAVIETMKQKIGQNASPTLSTVQKMKNVIADFIPERAWLKGKKGMNLTPKEERLVDAWWELKNIVKSTLKDSEEGQYLDYLDKKATDVYRLGRAIKSMVVDETGNPQKTTQLTGIFSGKPSMAGKRGLFERLKELNSETKIVISDMNKFKARQMTKSWTKRALPWVVGGSILGGGIKRGLENVGMGSVNIGRE
jgi:hypothetical protein